MGLFWGKKKAPVVQQEQPAVNASEDIFTPRQIAANSGGYDFADTMHNVFIDYGYPQSLDFFNYWNMYRRLGIAKNIVQSVPDICWITEPTIKGVDQIDILIKNVKLWQRLKGLDTRQRVGRYAGLFMRVKDGKKLSEPLEPVSSGVNALVSVTPVYESQLKVLTTDQDEKSDRFDLPVTYQYSTGAVGDRNANSSTSVTVHYTRVITTAEGADDGGIYGISELEAPYNSLMDVRKVIGGGAEGFYKNSAQNVVLETQPDATTRVDATLLAKFTAAYDDFAHNRHRRAMMAPGMKVANLQSDLISNKDFFQCALNDVSAASKIPSSIVIGHQTGRLASNEDGMQMRAICQSRRINYLDDMIGSVIDWCMFYSILNTSAYEIEWDDLLSLSATDKLINADKMSTINKTQFTSGGDVVFSGGEIREAAGYEAEPEEEIGSEELLEEVEIDEE